MAQLSGVAAAVEDQQRVFIGRQFALQFVELAVRNADGRGNIAFIVFGFFRPRIYEKQLICGQLSGHIFDRYRRVVAFDLNPFGKSIGEDFDIRITKFFRLPGGFVT